MIVTFKAPEMGTTRDRSPIRCALAASLCLLAAAAGGCVERLPQVSDASPHIIFESVVKFDEKGEYSVVVEKLFPIGDGTHSVGLLCDQECWALIESHVTYAPNLPTERFAQASRDSKHYFKVQNYRDLGYVYGDGPVELRLRLDGDVPGIEECEIKFVVMNDVRSTML